MPGKEYQTSTSIVFLDLFSVLFKSLNKWHPQSMVSLNDADGNKYLSGRKQKMRSIFGVYILNYVYYMKLSRFIDH